MTDEWTISPYVVGMLLDCPEDVRRHLAAVYRAAEDARRSLGYHPSQPAGKAIHAVVVHHYATEAHRRGRDAELTTWLDRAAAIVTSDAAIEIDQALDAMDATPSHDQATG